MGTRRGWHDSQLQQKDKPNFTTLISHYAQWTHILYDLQIFNNVIFQTGWFPYYVIITNKSFAVLWWQHGAEWWTHSPWSWTLPEPAGVHLKDSYPAVSGGSVLSSAAVITTHSAEIVVGDWYYVLLVKSRVGLASTVSLRVSEVDRGKRQGRPISVTRSPFSRDYSDYCFGLCLSL